MDTKTIVVLLISFFLAIIACEIGHKYKRLRRGARGRLAVSVICGFSGVLLSMLIMSSNVISVLVVPVVSGLYGYLMASAKVFDRIR